MIINFGSINIDRFYRVSTLPTAGETVSANSFETFLGGKGINQSIAIARAGGSVRHVGAVGADGDWVLSEIERLGVATSSIERLGGATGHAIVTVSDDAENQIIISSGTNVQFTEQMVEAALSDCNPDEDWILLQNETNLAEHIAKCAVERGFKIAYAAAPFVASTTLALLPHINLLAVNDVEVKALAGELGVSEAEIPVPELLVTRGAAGSQLRTAEEVFEQKAYSVDAVDTTGAGDTFLGNFLAQYCAGNGAETALQYAAAASALQVTQPGAATAIPAREAVDAFMKS